MAKKYDPLSCIPSADAVRLRLESVQEEAHRLGVLLRTAEEIEGEKTGDRDVEEGRHDA